MKRLLNRLVVANTEEENAEATDDSVEWTDISEETEASAGLDADTDQQLAESTDSSEPSTEPSTADQSAAADRHRRGSTAVPPV